MQLACLYSIILSCGVGFLESLVTLIDQAEPAFAQSSISRRIKALLVANSANSGHLLSLIDFCGSRSKECVDSAYQKIC
jgi:hypothetical protein